eukprot:CAMPEP_0171348668 /NCGR_PEP_ID=MMETSP0878-20121228/31529_1 /TAXON_ID=67004 /ORGANISM="Thalassiosira weissflogii, Strain CCMP1336" /LENGTH=168 /DNA_ID=CAMNT_0011853093 /DNA_START=36 /DNA_END=539 /DNA_ORIENTATION=+
MARAAFIDLTVARKQVEPPVPSSVSRRAVLTRRQKSKLTLVALDPMSLHGPSFSSSYTLSLNKPEQLQQVPQLLQNDTMQPVEQLSPTTTLVVFIIGIIPFVWATYEFWRRIAFGEPFGTGSDSVVIPSPLNSDNDENLISIGEDGNPASSRGRRTLDKGALLVAYVL